MKTTAARPGRFAKLIRRLAAEPGSATPDELRRLRNVRRSKMIEALGPENGAALFFRAADACRKRDQRALAKNTRLSAKFFRDPTPAKTAAAWDKLASRKWGRGDGSRINDMTFLHKLVAEGRIVEVAHLLRDELLRMTDCYKDIPVHYAAKGGTLDQFPSGILTADLLMVKNMSGEGAIQIAAERSALNTIPSPLFTAELLTFCGQPWGRSPLCMAVDTWARQPDLLDQIIAILPEMADEDTAEIAGLICEEASDHVQAHFSSFCEKTKALFTACLLAA